MAFSLDHSINAPPINSNKLLFNAIDTIDNKTTNLRHKKNFESPNKFAPLSILIDQDIDQDMKNPSTTPTISQECLYSAGNSSNSQTLSLKLMVPTVESLPHVDQSYPPKQL